MIRCAGCCAPCTSTPVKPAASAFRAPCAYCATMPGISDASSARGVGISSKPFAVKAFAFGRPNGGRRDRQGTAGLEGGMGDAPDMPELGHHAAATGMDCTGHAFPACDLLGAVDTRRADIALALGRDLGCFRDDESGAGPLGVKIGRA